ncbi:MAG: hypothetical protein FJ098_06260, partial [Deltaproteobacteria bacterium]|nr:hypothetical protein [Deltaproteobacteria bacterium]
MKGNAQMVQVGKRGLGWERVAAVPVALLLLTLLDGPVLACDWEGRYHRVLAEDFHSIGFTLCSEHFEFGSEPYLAVEAVVDYLNSIPGSSLTFHIEGFHEHLSYDETLEEDGANRIDINECTVTDCSYSGRAYKSPSTGDIEEFDITFKPSAEYWNFGDPEYWEIGVDTCFQQLLLHEIGHGLGFKHTGGDYDALSIMGHETGKFVGDRLVGFKPWDMGHLR